VPTPSGRNGTPNIGSSLPAAFAGASSMTSVAPCSARSLIAPRLPGGKRRALMFLSM
jgi:hypothetical protein